MPRSLDIARLSAFTVEGAPPPAAPEPAVPVPVAQETRPQPVPPVPPAPWPSREPAQDGQVSIKAPVEVIERFRRMCRDDRRTYADMLGILMDRFEGR